MTQILCMEIMQIMICKENTKDLHNLLFKTNISNPFSFSFNIFTFSVKLGTDGTNNKFINKKKKNQANDIYFECLMPVKGSTFAPSQQGDHQLTKSRICQINRNLSFPNHKRSGCTAQDPDKRLTNKQMSIM